MKNTFFIFIVLACNIYTEYLFSQNNLRFTHYTTREGLSNNIGNTIFQDSRGLLWIGTSNGLNYFDGVSFQNIYPTDFDKVHLHSDGIIQLAEDAKGNILLQTDDGIEEYNWNKQTFRLIFPKSMNGGIADFVTDKKKNIWLLSTKYLQQYNAQFKLLNNIRLDTLQNSTDKASFDLQFYFVDKANNLWFHYHNIMCEWDTATHRLTNKFNDVKHRKVFEIEAEDIKQDQKGNYWIVSNQFKGKSMVACYHPSTDYLETHPLKKSYNLLSLVFSPTGKLLITSDHQGLFIFDTLSKKFQIVRHIETNADSPSDDFFYHPFRDKDGNIWLGSEHALDKCTDLSGNFNVLNNFGYEDKTHRLKTEVENITAYKKDLLISTTGGFFRINTENLQQQRFQFSRNNHTLKDNYWFSFFINDNTVITPTWKGIVTYNVNEKKLHPSSFSTNHPALMDSVPVVSAFKDCRNNIWLGMLADNGIYCWNKNANTFVHYTQHQKTNRFPLRHFTCAAEDDNGNIWMGYDKGGIAIFDIAAQKFTQPSFAAFKNISSVHAMLNDHRRNLWITTSEGLLCYSLKTHSAKQYNRTDGLISNVVMGMAFDKHGVLWMATYSGLSRFDTSTKQFTNFTIVDGLPEEKIDQVIYDSAINKICFTTRFTVCLFNPDHLRKNTPALYPVITSFSVMGKQRSLCNSSVKLSYRENFFAFNYTAADFINADDVKYEYKLNGFNKNWTNAGKRQYASYTNLNGGGYIFRLRATDDNGMHWYEMAAPVSIYIETPFFKTFWFYLLMCVVIITIIFLFIYSSYRSKLKRIVTALKIRNEIARDLHDDVGSSLSSIMLMSELAKKQQAPAEDYFDKIKENAGKIIENMNDIVWAINPNNDTMEQLLIRMQSFASSLLDKKNIALQFKTCTVLPLIKLNMTERKNFYLIFKEAIHNAFKYAQCSNVCVQINKYDKNICIMIKDDGKGFDTVKNYIGNGFYNMKKRAKELNGKLDIVSECRQGTTLSLSFAPTQKSS